jgi:hypothetical protein
MLRSTSQYIDLTSGSNKIADNAERKYSPEFRTAYLSGKCRRLIEDRERGIPILECGREGRAPILDIRRILKVLLYGLGFTLIVTGVVFMFGNREGK